MPGVDQHQPPDLVVSERPAIPQRSNSFFRPRSLNLPNLVIEHNRPNVPPVARQQVTNESLLFEVRDQLDDVLRKIEQILRIVRVVHRNQDNIRANE